MKKLTISLFLMLFVASTTYAQQCVERVICNDYATTAIFTDGRLYSWGLNENGELGNGTTEIQASAQPTVMGESWQDISHGYRHTLALHNDGSIWAWGKNEHSQLGDGTTDNKLSPIQIGGDTDWIAVSAGFVHSMALKADGSMWGWGNNQAMEFENSSTNMFPNPFQIHPDADWAKIEAGCYRTFGIKTDGTLWVRGNSSTGALGIGQSGGSVATVWKQVGQDSTWARIESALNHTVAMKTDGTLWTWGKGESAGQGSTANVYAPTQIGNEQWKDFSIGKFHSLAIKMDGTLWEWGIAFWFSSQDEILYPEKLNPEQVGNDDDWKTVAGGTSLYIAVKNDHTLWMWGWNEGRYGNGTTARSYDPTMVRDCESAVNTDDANFEKTTFYPNPVNDVLEWTNNTDFATYHITNMLGQTIKTGQTNGSQLNLSELKTGMYILLFQTKDGKDVRHKFLKS